MLEMASLSVEVMNRCVPIIVILGGTGTGKSKLGIQIAKRIGGEIISADSMQVYKGLNILTNKVTEEEKDGVVHHLLDFVEPPRTYTVVDFRNEALPIMDRLLEQKKSPVIVGGTNYYIESLLWKVLVADKTKDNLTCESKAMENLAFRLGLRPISGNSKRKADETDKAPLDAKGRFLLTVREVCFMFGYPGKVIDLFYDKLKACKEDVGKILFIKNLTNIDDNVDDNIDDERCPTCQSMKKTIVEVADLKQQIEGLVEEWQSTNPSLDLGGILKNCHNVDLKMVSTVEESLKDVHRQLSDLLAPCVQRLEAKFGKDFRLEIDVEDIPSPDLHKYLSQVDQQRAIYMHPNNKRKIIRSLCVWAETGRRHSEILEEQKVDGSLLGGPLRYKDVIIFWLTCDQEVLEKRLDERIDEMFDRGLVQELIDFHKKFNPEDVEYTKGIFQSIGFRNFSGYLRLDDEKRSGPEGQKMFNEGRKTFSIETKRYVKSQNKWVRNRFLSCITREVPPVYKLDTSDVEHWTEQVLEPAMEVVTSLIVGGREAGAVRLQPLAVEEATSVASSEESVTEVLKQKHEVRRCDVCDRMFIGELQLNDHLKSAKHQKAEKRRKLLELEQQQQQQQQQQHQQSTDT